MPYVSVIEPDELKKEIKINIYEYLKNNELLK